MNEPASAVSPKPAPAVASAPLPLWRRRWLHWTVGGIGAFIAALLLFIAYALPGIVRAQAERIVAEKLHRRLSIERVEIHPLALAASVQGLRLLEADGKEVFVAFERLDLRLSAATLTSLAPIVREVHLSKPYVHLARTAPNRYSTDDILAALAAGPPPAPPPPNAPPARFSINNIQIDGGHFVFDDLPKSAHHDISDFSLGLPFLSTFASAEEVFVEPRLSAKINGAPLRLAGKARPFAPEREAAVDIDLDDVDLTQYLEYLPAPPPVRVAAARLDLHASLKVTLDRDQPPLLDAAGKLLLRGLDLRTPAGKPLVAFKTLELALDGARYPSGPLAATLTVNGKGRVSAKGDVAAAPLHADLAVQVDDLDLLPLQPLFADRVNLRVTRAGLAARTRVQVDQPADGPLRGTLAGDVMLNRLATVDSVNNNDFVNWDRLAVLGMRVQLAPLAVHVDQVALDNLFARVIISPSGRINLQDIVKEQAQAKISLTDNSAAGTAALERTAPAPAPVPATAAAAGPPGPPVSIGKVLIKGGHVRFSDNFIKPRYSADLVELNGAVEGLSSDPASTASVDVHGKVNDAPLLVGGRVNPLKKDLALDIKASVHDMELAPLSPYSAKYAGYRIERGKLSFDVAYQLQDRQLKAENRLVLDQLTFGDHVENTTATSLPVQLAVALLKDRNGVIDINLPIGGSLDDPEFSVGGVIVKVLLNLITKAVTAPFALLGNLFGGGSEELSTVDFDPGSAAIAPARESKLKALATAMTERPGLKLDITGWADPAGDGEALRRLRVDARLRALKRQDLAARGALGNAAEVVVTPEEYPGLLARAYKLDVVDHPIAADAKSPAAGAAAGAGAPPAPADMEAALRARQQVNEDDLRALGNRRAQAAKDWLRTIGLVPEERLSIVDAKMAPAPGGESPAPGAPAAASASRVEFGLR